MLQMILRPAPKSASVSAWHLWSEEAVVDEFLQRQPLHWIRAQQSGAYVDGIRMQAGHNELRERKRATSSVYALKHLHIASTTERWVAVQELKEDRADTPQVYLVIVLLKQHDFRGHVQTGATGCLRVLPRMKNPSKQSNKCDWISVCPKIRSPNERALLITLNLLHHVQHH